MQSQNYLLLLHQIKPIMHTREEKLEAFGRLLDVLDRLRKECPWDRKQTNESLRPNTIEETFELCDALMKDDTKNICKELGDVIMHVIFYARIGEEQGKFDIADVCNRESDKLIFRHPHVYGEAESLKHSPLQHAEKGKELSSGQVLENWEQIKLKEKDGNKSVRLSRHTAYRTRRVMWASTGKTNRTCGQKCARNSMNWRLN